MDLKDLNIFDVASCVMKFIQAGLLSIEHEGTVVQPTGINPVNGKVVLATKAVAAVAAAEAVVEAVEAVTA